MLTDHKSVSDKDPLRSDFFGGYGRVFSVSLLTGNALFYFFASDAIARFDMDSQVNVGCIAEHLS